MAYTQPGSAGKRALHERDFQSTIRAPEGGGLPGGECFAPPPSLRGSAPSNATGGRQPRLRPKLSVRAEHAFPPTQAVYTPRVESHGVETHSSFCLKPSRGSGVAFGSRAPYGAGRLRRRPRFARRGLSSLGLGLATLGLAKLRKSLFASCLIGWACSIALAAAKPWYLCRGLSKSATFFCCFAIQQASAGGMGGWHAVPKRSGGSPVDALVPLGALGLRFPMFRRATFWDYVFRCVGAYDALARRLCSESLPR